MPKAKLTWTVINLEKSNKAITQAFAAELKAKAATNAAVAAAVAKARNVPAHAVKVGRGFDGKTLSFAIDEKATTKTETDTAIL